MVDRIMPAIEAGLPRTDRTIVLDRVGLLARYGRMDVIERLRDRVGARSESTRLHGLWVVVPAEGEHPEGPPKIDGVALPVLTPAQWVVVRKDWLENRHRSTAAG